MPLPEAEWTQEFVEWSNFLRGWEMEILNHDRGNFQDHGSLEANVYLYIDRRLRWVLDNVQGVGQAGWRFYRTAHDDGCWTRAIIWTEAQSSQRQSTPVEDSIGGERWWPAIVADIPGLDILPVYCPGLAWQSARPWFVHRSRVQILPQDAPWIFPDEDEEDAPWIFLEELD